MLQSIKQQPNLLGVKSFNQTSGNVESNGPTEHQMQCESEIEQTYRHQNQMDNKTDTAPDLVGTLNLQTETGILI